MFVDRADVSVCGLSGVWSVCLTGSIMCSSYVKLPRNTRMRCFLLVNSAAGCLWLSVWFLRQRSGTRPTLSCLPVSRGTSFECPRTAVWPTHSPAPAKLFTVFVRIFFLSRQFWALVPCQFMGLNTGLCSRLFAARDEECKPWEPGEESQPRSLRLTWSALAGRCTAAQLWTVTCGVRVAADGYMGSRHSTWKQRKLSSKRNRTTAVSFPRK